MRIPPATLTPKEARNRSPNPINPAGHQDRSRVATKPSKKSTEEGRSYSEMPGAGPRLGLGLEAQGLAPNPRPCILHLTVDPTP